MSRAYQTKNIELAAAIQTIASEIPLITYNDGLATFNFRLTQQVADVVMGYESGIQSDARQLLNNRNKLYKRIRGV